MKIKIDSIVVVEGKSDVDFIKSFIDADIIITNGTSVSRETIDYLKKASKTRNIIVLTDPDYPGMKIRNILNENIDNLTHAYIRKEVSIKKGKVGVAESTKNEIIKALSNIHAVKPLERGNLNANDLYKLGLTGNNNSFELRKEVSQHFSLGFTNGKSLLKRLNEFAIDYKTIEEYINGNKEIF